jgi:hypothetical protein
MTVTVNLRVGRETLIKQHSRQTPQNTPIQPVAATTNLIGGCNVIQPDWWLKPMRWVWTSRTSPIAHSTVQQNTRARVEYVQVQVHT